ncbi:hypothetical protein HDR58_02110, partial [bacterium]|nr:hypothetical protein [bacterium]
MSKLASKLNKRIMATVLSVAMVMSNMTVYASEVTGPQADNTVEEVATGAEDTSVTPDDATTSDDNTNTDAVVDDKADDSDSETADDGTGDDAQTPDTGKDDPSDPDKVDEVGTDEDPLENDEEVKDEEEISAGAINLLINEAPSYDGYETGNKVDVWDFGGATLEGVNNMLTTTDIESITTQLATSDSKGAEIEVTTDSTAETKDTFTIVKEDSEKVEIADLPNVDVNKNDPYFSSGSYAKALTIQANNDEGKKTGYITLSAKKGDTFTIVAYAEGTAPAVTLTKVDDSTVTEQPTPSENITTFANEDTHIIRLFASDDDFKVNDGDDLDSVTYEISSTSDMTIARIYRGNKVELSGSVTGLDNAEANAKLIFTPSDETSDADPVEAKITTSNEESTYTATLKNGVEYTVSVGDCDVTVGDDTDANNTVTAIKNDTKNITIEAKTAETVILGGSIAFKDSKGAALSDTDETAAFNGLGTITFEPVTADASDDNSTRSGDSAEGTVTATVNKTAKTYTATLVKGTTYKMVVSNETTYKSIAVSGISDLNAVKLTAAKEDADITITMKADDGNDPTPSGTARFILEASALKAANETFENGRVDKKVGTDGFFSVYYKLTGKSSWKDAETEFKDGYKSSVGINFGGNGSISDSGKTSLVEFTTTEAAYVKVYWTSGGGGTRKFVILDSDGNAVEGKKTESAVDAGGTAYVSTILLEDAGTYYLAPNGGSSNLYKLTVTEGRFADNASHGDWENVEAPEITKVEVLENTINVTVKGVVNSSGDGADLVTVKMYNSDHLALDDPQPIDAKEKDTPTGADQLSTLIFTPSNSGSYAFKAFLSRNDAVDENGEVTETYEDKTSAFSAAYEFKLPLATPEITTLMNIDGVYGDEEDEEGNRKLISGGITATWRAITEADYYILYAKNAAGTTINSTKTEGTSAEVPGLTIGDTVAVSVIAYRENAEGEEPDKSAESESKDIEITGVRPHAYTFDALDYADEAPTDESGFQAAGTKYGTDDYFTGFKLASTPDKGFILRKNSSGSIVWMQLYQKGGSGVKFTVYGEADATFKVASTGGGNWSVFALQDSDGKFVEGTINGLSTYTYAGAPNAGAYCTQNTDISTIEYKGLKAGTYTFSSPELNGDDKESVREEYKRGGRIHSIAVYDNGDMPERGSWDSVRVGTPEISEIKYVKGESEIKVTASGYIGYYGADSLMVDMLDSEGNAVETIIKAEDSDVTKNEDDEIISWTNKPLEFSFKPTASGNYSFKASLVRSGEKDIVMTDEVKDWTVKDFVLPLATPSVGTMTNMEDDKKSDSDADSDTESTAKSGALEVIFSGVDEADYYVVAALSGKTLLDTEYIDIEAYEDAEDAESPVKLSSVKSEKEYTVTLKGLPIGDCYVTVQAFRKTDSKLNLAATTTTLTRVPATGDETKDTVDEKVEDTTDGSKATTPTADGFATAVARSKTFMPSASKYVNGKTATRWSHTVYGSNTSRSNYTRKEALNRLDGEYPVKDSAGNIQYDEK